MMKLFKVNEIFDLSINTNSSNFTKAFINQHKGSIPVYGATSDHKLVGYGYVEDNLENVKYFEDCLTWNIDGSMCVIHKRNGRFSLSEKVIPLILFEKWKGKINENFLKLSIENKAKNFGFGYGNKAGKTKLGELQIQIPTLEDGTFDMKAQQKYVDKYKKIRKIQLSLKQNYEILSSSLVHVENIYDKKQIFLGEKHNDEQVFCLEIGERVLKKDVCKAGISLYSANVKKPFGYIAKSNLNDFSRPSLIWGIDGNFDWNYIEEDICFATTDHCGRLIIKNKNLNPKFVWYQLKLSARQYGFNRVFRASLDNMKEQVSIEIPITKDGQYDLKAQNELVQKFETIERIQNLVRLKLKQGVLANIEI